MNTRLDIFNDDLDLSQIGKEIYCDGKEIYHAGKENYRPVKNEKLTAKKTLLPTWVLQDAGLKEILEIF